MFTLPRLCLLVFLLPLAVHAEKTVLFIAGAPSHGPGEHKFPDGCRLLADALNKAHAGLRADVSLGWPADPDAVDKADVVVLYSDGLGNHIAKGHLDALRRRLAAGKGLAVLHFALEPGEEKLRRFLEDAVGGWFAVDWSVNPIWTLSAPLLAPHPVSAGVNVDGVKDEWYYHLRFRPDVTPVLQALPPAGSISATDGSRSGNPTIRAELVAGTPQTLAWVVENANGARGFGFTGGHYHYNWGHDGVRKLVLNALVWTAHIAPPAAGVTSTVAPILRFPTVDQAIAAGDLDDLKRHLAANPASLNQGARPGMTPLHQAILRNKTDIALFLLDAGADPALADSDGRSPLHLAVERKNLKVLQRLLALKAPANVRDKIGWTPLHHSAARNLHDIGRALLEGGADVKTLSERGGTALHEAAASGDAAFVRLLLDHGVDPAVKSGDGRTALDIAREFKNEPVIGVLSALPPPKP